jgi:hypothetical protein
MGRLVGWTLGTVLALAIGAAPAAADTRWSVGVHIGNGPVYGPYYPRVYYPPVYRAPVYRAPVYRERVYYPAYPVYDPYYYRPAYRDRVVVVRGRHDNGRHRGWYKGRDRGRGPAWRDDRRGRRR